MKRFFLLLSFFSLLYFFPSFTAARSYPLADLPQIQNADYFSYRNLPSYRSTYSMLRLSTYFDGRDVGIGSHQGIDIVAKSGTSVSAIASGTVIVADQRGDRGNVVVIRHQRNGQFLFSTYAHLSSLAVQVGQEVAEGEKIGEVGDTGNATGPHLHFQLERNQDDNHPFFPKGCQGTIDEIVNEGTCFAKVRAATLDPIVFLETTTKLAGKTDTPLPSVYLSAKDILLSGLTCGFMEPQHIATLTITKKAGGGLFLSAPITISGGSGLLIASPEKIQVLESERKIFLQTTTSTGLALVNVNYGEKTLASYLLFVDTPEHLALLKQNEKLVNLLQKCGFQK
jgi:hypothetical protein